MTKSLVPEPVLTQAWSKPPAHEPFEGDGLEALVSDIERMSCTYTVARREGREEGREEGLVKGREEGLVKLRQACSRALRRHDLSVTTSLSAAIEACEDTDILLELLARAHECTSVEDAHRRLTKISD